MSDDLEANLATVESPLLHLHPRKRWRKVVSAVFIALALSRSTHVQECPKLEMTPVLPNNPKYRLRVAFITLRSMAAFSQAGDALTPASQSDTVITLEQDGLSDLVRSQNGEQLRQLGGIKGVASALKTDTDSGIKGNTESSVDDRRMMFGSNRVEKPAPEIKQVVWETIKDPIIIFLLLCAVLSLGFGITKHGLKGWSDGGGIFAAVFVVVAVTAYCKIWSRRQIFELARAGEYFTIDVKRNGKTHQIFVFDVVVGDVISLKHGDRIPADGLYIHGDSLQVEEPSITEEVGSRKIKDSNDPFLLSGSKVTSGSAQMLVTAVGTSAAQWKMLKKHCDDANQKTPLEKKLHKLAMVIAMVGFVVAFLVLVVLLIRYFTGNMQDDHGKSHFIAGKTRIHHVCFAVIGILATPFAIASTAIPEGLLLAVIIPIAYSTNKMAAAQKALVRNLSAWEEIGSTTVICTNERGNLTSQELIVSRFWHGEETFSSIAQNVREQLLQGFVSDSTEVSPGSTTESIGHAIQKWAFQPMIEDAEQIRANCKFLHQKGDPEGILAKCSQYYDQDGNIKEITTEVRESLKQIILEMKSEFPQCLGFSCSDVLVNYRNSNENFHPQQKEKCFTLIGVAGLTYKCPTEIKEAVTDCQRAGVKIKLVTRGELSAAKAIAFECGILDRNDDKTTGQVVEGIEFQNYPKEERLEKSDKIRVMARASTLARYYLVKDLIEKGHVVAVTGDSVGDATVLKEATIGLSLGIEGTNIAKENSDIIILNDSFESIAKALRWGRGMYWKIQKYTQFQLTVSISSLVIDFVTAISASEPPNIKIVATISAGKAPFAALQVLWAKLIVGILAALAITREEPKEKLHQLPFVKKTEQFLTGILWKNIVGQALYPIVVLLTINFKGESVFNMDPKVKDTMIFNIFVLWQLFTIFTTKKFEVNIIRWIQREKVFWSIVGSIFLLQFVFVEVLERFAGTKRLNWMQWAACFGLASLAWPIGWLVKRTNVPGCLSSA